MLDILKNANRIIVKIGSSLIINQEDGLIRTEWLKSLIDDLATLQKQGKDIIIITSGAVALGKQYINIDKKPLKLEEKQAAAACGQPNLIYQYQELFNKYNIYVSQTLITLIDLESRRNYLNAKNTIETLLSHKIIPIINENDTVATEELRFGDNDRLAAKVAQMVSADLLILLSDVDGLYTGNPRIEQNAKHIKNVSEITPQIENMASGALSNGIGSGGMVTKIAAAKIALYSGCSMILASGKATNPLSRLTKDSKYTLFSTKDDPYSARKRWIASSLNIKGDIIIDPGAVKALNKGKSLLPAGVIDIKGDFQRGDAVNINDSNFNQIGIGLIAYSCDDAKLIIGQRSQEIANIVGFSGRNELIHRDNLVLTANGRIDNESQG